MPPKKILKYILDIESVIRELELVIEINERDYSKFSTNFMAVRTVERDLEIIGEAVRKITYLIQLLRFQALNILSGCEI